MDTTIGKRLIWGGLAVMAIGFAYFLTFNLPRAASKDNDRSGAHDRRLCLGMGYLGMAQPK